MENPEAAIQTSHLVSVVIPVLNEEKDIGNLLDALLNQAPPSGGFEVLVADGGSTDTTRDIVNRIAAKDPRVRLIDNPNVRSGAGRNAGARAARGDYVLFLDGHCSLPRSDYLVRMVEIFQATGAACLCRPQPLRELDDAAWAKAIARARHSWLGHYPGSDIYKHESTHAGSTNPHSAGAAYQRRVLFALGGYDERFDACEDVEFNHRVALAGEKAYFHPDLKVCYRPRGTLRGLFRQMQRYGRGRARLMARHPTIVAWPLLIASVPVVAGLLATLLSHWETGLLVLGLATCVWGGAVLVESFLLGRGRAISLRIGAAFITLHVGMLFGFWRGLMEWREFRHPGRWVLE